MARNFTGPISILSIQLIMQINRKPIKDPKIASANTPRVFAGLRRVSWTYLQFAAFGSLCETEPRYVICEQFVDLTNSKPFVRLVADLCETPPSLINQ